MNDSVKRLFSCEQNYPVRYSIYNTHFNDITIYKKKRKNYVKNEFINVDFVYVPENFQSECANPLSHIEL